MATKTIKFLQGGGFVERQTNADTVEHTQAIQEGDIVAAVNNNKSGGDE